MLGHGTHAVFVDANVWFSRTLRDWVALLYLRREFPLFQIYWSEDVLAEALSALRRTHPDWPGHKVRSVRDNIAATFEFGRVEDFTTDGYTGTDGGDAHVHGAARACKADILLTCNTDDFPEDDNYEVMHPDDFFILVDDSEPSLVREAVLENATFWLKKNTQVHLPHSLQRNDCPQFAERVRLHLQTLQDELSRC